MKHTKTQLVNLLVDDHCDSVREMAIQVDTSWVADIFENGWTGYSTRSYDELYALASENGLIDSTEEE